MKALSLSLFLFQVQTELKRRLWTWQTQTHLSPSKKQRVTVTQIMMHDSTHSQTAVCNGYITSVWTHLDDAEDFRSFTSGSDVQRRGNGSLYVITKVMLQIPWSSGFGRCHLSSVSLCRTTSRLWHRQCKCVEVWLMYRFDWSPCCSKCFINILVVF